MDHASEGFERIAVAILEMQQRTEVLLAENRHLQAELAALRQGAGDHGRRLRDACIRWSPGWATPNDPLYPPR